MLHRDRRTAPGRRGPRRIRHSIAAAAAAATVEGLEPRKLLSVALVKDIVSGSGASDPTNLTAAGDIVYFVATDW